MTDNDGSKGTNKHKETPTPDLDSTRASAPICKRVKYQRATLQHGLTPGINVKLSLHDTEDKDNKDEENNDNDGEKIEDYQDGNKMKE